MSKKAEYLKKSILILLMFLCSISMMTLVKAKEKKVIRVGYPIQEGLTMKDADGNHYGYTYDYLMQIAQYTGWEYEFVEVEGSINDQLMTMLDKLKKKEIDLLGCMRYSDELADLYDYSSEPYGNAYNVIASSNDSAIFDQSSLMNKNNLKIAVLKSSKLRLEKLDLYTAMNGITYEKILCSSMEEMQAAIENKQADALYTVDLELPANYHTIVRFSPDAFYFATPKGSTEIVSELNQAIMTITQVNPLFTSTLYNRYFNKASNDIILNDKEQAYIQNQEEIKVLVFKGNAPLQFMKNGNSGGIAVDILKYISKKTGLKFSYIQCESMEEVNQIMATEKIDILLSIPYEMSIADQYNVNLTYPYITSNLLLVARNEIQPGEYSDKTQAVSTFSGQHIDTNSKTKSYESAEDILIAIDHDEVDYAYLDSYLVTYYTNKHGLKDVSTFTVPEYLRSQFSFGVVKSEDLSLLGILNKGINSMDEDDLNTYIYQNAYLDQSFNLVEYIEKHVPQTIGFLLLLLCLIAVGIMLYYRHQLKMKRAVELEYMRYKMLSGITGEMTFEYDYQLDEMKISNSGIGKLATQEVINNLSKRENQEDKDVISHIYQYVMRKEDLKCETNLQMIDGEENWYQITMKVIYDLGRDKHKAVYAIGKVINIQAEKMEKELLLKKSLSDSLTGILNRAGAQAAINKRLASDEKMGALIMSDLDNFKDVNDQYGHFEGDKVLIDTAQLLSTIFTDGIVARLGGDEFVIYQPATSKQELARLCEEILSRLQHIPSMLDKKFTLTMSMGIVFTSQSKDLNELLQLADDKLYEIKRSGRNGYQL